MKIFLLILLFFTYTKQQNRTMKLLAGILLFLSVGFQSQIRRLDLEKYEEKAGKRDGYYQYKENDSIFTVLVNPDFYVERRKRENWIREKTYAYYKDTYRLAFEGEYFLGVPTGIHKKYSREGQLIDQTDYEAQVRNKGLVTRDDLAKVMKKKFGINIEKEEELVMVDTVEKEGKLLWRIICKPHPEKGVKHHLSYLFDAKSGVFLAKEKYVLIG